MQKLDKNIIRKEILYIRNTADQKFAVNSNKIILKTLLNSSEYNFIEDIFTYVSVKNEVDTLKLIEHAFSIGKKVAVPKIMRKGIMNFYYINSLDQLKAGKFDLLEPIDCFIEAIPNSKSLMIIPGVAFDKLGNRLGYGGGFYDRYLSKHEFHKTVALAYSFQIIDKIPIEFSDIKMDAIVTESEIFGNLN